jgi:hypothetical protein
MGWPGVRPSGHREIGPSGRLATGTLCLDEPTAAADGSISTPRDILCGPLAPREGGPSWRTSSGVRNQKSGVRSRESGLPTRCLRRSATSAGGALRDRSRCLLVAIRFAFRTTAPVPAPGLRYRGDIIVAKTPEREGEQKAEREEELSQRGARWRTCTRYGALGSPDVGVRAASDLAGCLAWAGSRSPHTADLPTPELAIIGGPWLSRPYRISSCHAPRRVSAVVRGHSSTRMALEAD